MSKRVQLTFYLFYRKTVLKKNITKTIATCSITISIFYKKMKNSYLDSSLGPNNGFKGRRCPWIYTTDVLLVFKIQNATIAAIDDKHVAMGNNGRLSSLYIQQSQSKTVSLLQIACGKFQRGSRQPSHREYFSPQNSPCSMVQYMGLVKAWSQKIVVTNLFISIQSPQFFVQERFFIQNIEFYIQNIELT